MALTQTDLKQIKTLITESLADFYQNLLLPHFATKDDLNGFATKDDLNGFATKEDLNGFATKEDLNGFATKEDLKDLATKADLNSFVTKDEYLTGQDEIMSELKTIREEMAFTHHRVYDEHQPQLEDHEIRITNLEI